MNKDEIEEMITQQKISFLGSLVTIGNILRENSKVPKWYLKMLKKKLKGWS